MATLICIIVLFICVITPALLTIFNIINLFKKKKIKENFIDYTTFILGIFLTVFWYIVQNFKDYTEGLRLGGFEIEVHSPIASWSMPTVLGIFTVGLISYILIRKRKLNLPPLAIVCAMSGTVICSIYMVMFIIQISKNFDIIEVPFFAIFPINYILCSLRAQIEVIVANLIATKMGEVGVREAASIISEILSKAGFNMNFAPVLDLKRLEADEKENAFL